LLSWDLDGVTVKTQRAVVVEKNVRPLLKVKEIGNKEFCPLFSVPFGQEGEFLISLISQDCNENIGKLDIINKLLLDYLLDFLRR
ncbi:MAG: hypothetical protein KC414_06590, partial [Romboutsia sp.]|nr:hypothetical protein [Romboutsia sp.]